MSESAVKTAGPKLLAWWTDKYGKDWQMLQDDDWYAVRSRESGEWAYLGTWIDDG